MTWVIGISTAFGYGIVLSDICVTYEKDGKQETINALQKAYPLGPFIIGGFAGSVDIGLRMLRHLHEFLRIPKSEGDYAWKVDWVAKNWQPMAQKIFNKYPRNEQAAGSHLLILGAHPTEDVGIPGEAKVHIAVLKSPNFDPIIREDDFLVIESIGTGAEAYKTKLEIILKNPFDIAQMEVNNPGGMGQVLKSLLTDCLKKNPVTGISEHLHTFLVRRGEIICGNNDYHEWCQDGTEFQFEMPPLAKSHKELLEILKTKNGKAILIA